MSSQKQASDRFEGYVPVSERIARFYERHPEGRILTALVEHDPQTGFVLMRAEVYRDGESLSPAATGHAYEIRGEGHVNKTSHIENCETGAVGRALANLGLEVKQQSVKAVRHLTTDGPRAVDSDRIDPATNKPITLDKRIMEALEILGKSEDELNAAAIALVGMPKGGDWTDLPVTKRQELLAFLNRKIDERNKD